MVQLQTYGLVESYSLYCLQVTCLLMILISWTFIKRRAFLFDLVFFSFLKLNPTSLHICIVHFYYMQISAAEFTCPPWLSLDAMKLIARILDPNPMTVSKLYLCVHYIQLFDYHAFRTFDHSYLDWIACLIFFYYSASLYQKFWKMNGSKKIINPLFLRSRKLQTWMM